MRSVFLFAAASVGIVPIGANACNPARFPTAPEISAWAQHGFLIRGRVVQGFDPIRQQPEIIEAEEVFVGERTPRRFVLYHQSTYFKTVKWEIEAGRPLTMCGPLPYYKKGDLFERLLLVPARAGNDTLTSGRWMITGTIGYVGDKDWLNPLLNEAVARKRMVKRPQQSFSLRK